MTKIESLELELAARKMADGTELEWWEVVRHYRTGDSFSKDLCFSCDVSNYELALGIIEGKPVWKGDVVWFTREDGAHYQQIATVRHDFTLSGWSWNPPKPKTIMVELEYDVATSFDEHYRNLYPHRREFENAICKALQNSK